MDALLLAASQWLKPEDLSVLKASIESDLQQLNGVLADAIAGRPRSFQYLNSQGQMVSIAFDADTIRILESLIAAGD